jgi:hypothetical protein
MPVMSARPEAAVADAYRARWGEPVRRARFSVAGFEIDVLKWSAGRSGEGTAMYATVGASEYAMPGWPSRHRVEFFIGLLPELDAVASPLAALGLYSQREQRMLDHGHVVPIGGALWPGTDMSALLVMRPRDGFLPALDGRGQVHVEFWQAIPVHGAERDFILERGAAALLSHWEQRGVPFWNPARASAVPD